MGRFLLEPGFLLARINQIYVALHNDVAGVETIAQTELLLLLADTEKVDQISLARRAGLDTSTTALILDNLESRGLVVRESDAKDRRRSVLNLTAAGRSRAAAARRPFDQTQLRLVEGLNRVATAELTTGVRLIAADPQSTAPAWLPEEREPAAANIVTGSPGFLCRRALQVCEAHFLACTAPLSLTPRQYSVLFLMKDRREMNQAWFSKTFGLDPATSAVILKNLTSRGLLDRRASSKDRRERLFSLTPQGRQTFQAAKSLVDRSDRLIARGFTKAGLQRLVSNLQHIVKTHRHRLTFPGAYFDH